MSDISFALLYAEVDFGGRAGRVLRLEVLGLENTIGVGDAGLVHLKGLANLRELNLDGTKVTDAGVKGLQKALPKLKIIH